MSRKSKDELKSSLLESIADQREYLEECCANDQRKWDHYSGLLQAAEEQTKKLDGRLSLYAEQQLGIRDGLAELKGTVMDDLEQIEHRLHVIEHNSMELSKNSRRCSELERHMRNVQGQADTLGQRSHRNQESIHVLNGEVQQLEELTTPRRKLLDRVRCAWREFWGE